MLNSFSAANFRSIKEKQTLRLIQENKGVIPIMAIYGANAAGKSNTVKVLKALEWFILISNKLDPGDKIGANEFFAFDVNKHHQPTEFEIDFIAKNTNRYRFSVIFTQKEVLYESLYQSVNPKKETWQKLYIREKGKEIDFGEFLKGPRKQIEELLIENQLFLSKAAANRNEQLRSVFEFFKETLFVNTLNSDYDELQLRMLAQTIQETQTLEILNNIITKIDLGILRVSVDDAQLPKGLLEFDEKTSEEDKKRFLEMIRYELKTIHRLFDGETEIGEYPLSLKEASEGTQKFISLFVRLINILRSGSVLVIDELDKSFHPLLTQMIVDLFKNPDTNPKQAQLIFTTHDATLLNHLEREQICLIQKTAKGETRIQKLSDQRGVRSDSPFEKWYLEGRLNATPNILKNSLQNAVKELVVSEANS